MQNYVDKTVFTCRHFILLSPYHAQSKPDHFHNPVSVAFLIISVKPHDIIDRLYSHKTRLGAARDNTDSLWKH